MVQRVSPRFQGVAGRMLWYRKHEAMEMQNVIRHAIWYLINFVQTIKGFIIFKSNYAKSKVIYSLFISVQKSKAFSLE